MRQVTAVEVVTLEDGRQVVRQRRVPPPRTPGTLAQPLRRPRDRAGCWSVRGVGRFVLKRALQEVLQYPLAEVVEGVAEHRAPSETDLRVGLPAVPVRSRRGTERGCCGRAAAGAAPPPCASSSGGRGHRNRTEKR